MTGNTRIHPDEEHDWSFAVNISLAETKGGMTDVGAGAERHATLGISWVSFDLQSVTKLRIELKPLERKVIKKTLEGEWACFSLSIL